MLKLLQDERSKYLNSGRITWMICFISKSFFANQIAGLLEHQLDGFGLTYPALPEFGSKCWKSCDGSDGA